MRTNPVLCRLLTLLVILGLFSGILQPVARAQENTHTTYLPAVSDSRAQVGELLYRTLVTVRTTVQWRDLERMNPVFLDQGDDWALLLVDDIQLADLARLRYNPEQSNGLTSLVTANQAVDAAAAASLRPLLEQATVFASQMGEVTVAEAAHSTLQAAIHALDSDQQAFLITAINADTDNDGLTNDQESWWCTDPSKADTDSDSVTDGNEVTALKEWLNNQRVSYPSSGKPFQGWPPQKINCFDDDQDSIPDLAESLDLGLNPSRESTDRDKFDDGQELFGQTYCTGQGGFCSYGPLPRNEDWGVIFAEMPSWVKAPGSHPLVTAYPIPKITVNESSLHVETVTTVTSDVVVTEGTERAFGTSETTGTSTEVTIADTWNDWQEVSESIQTIASASILPATEPDDSWWQRLKTSAIDSAKSTIADGMAMIGCINLEFDIDIVTLSWDDSLNQAKCNSNRKLACDLANNNSQFCPVTTYEPVLQRTDGMGNVNVALDNQVIVNSSFDTSNLATALEGIRLSQNNSGQIIADRLYSISHALLAPRRTDSTTRGHSQGGWQSTSTQQYQEHTISNSEAFLSEESWGTATAADSSHAADLWFSFTVQNVGTEYAREIANLAFNVYIGEGDVPAYTYFVASDIGGSGKLLNFMPTEEHTYLSRRIPLSLEQMKVIDLGGKIRIELEDFTYGLDELFYQDAANAGVVIALEDGTDDKNDTIDTYLIPTWGQEDVLDVLARYFPHSTDSNGMLVAIWTPEYRIDTPVWCHEPRRPLDQATKAVWCKHDLSVADWWNIYTDGLGDSSEGFQDTQAVPGGVALFRFNQDSDHDGFSDRSETQLGTDPDDASSYAFPEVLAGVHEARTGNNVVATLSLLNTGFYDAYGVEAIMVAPDDSVTITKNTVGGSGRVRSQQQVIVGSRILSQSPTPASWTQAGHAAPAAGGYYTGNADRTYTFTVNCPAGGCSVGSGTWTVGWSDGAGGTGTLNFGSGYSSPTFLPVGNAGLTLALYSGTVQNGESFTIYAQTPRDTFQYTINREPYTEPLVIVSYNDPQGNHRFLLPPAAIDLAAPTDNLQVFAGQMIDDIGVEIVTRAPYIPGNNSVELLVNNPSDVTLDKAHLFLEIVNISGTVVSQVPTQVDIPPGPNYVSVNFSSNSFTPAFKSQEEYIVMAFFTDQAGNILDTAGRPLSSFQVDPLPELIADTASLTWNFGTVAKGTLLKHPLAIANTGFGPLYTYIPTTPGLVLDQSGADTVGAADLSSYELTLRTGDLPQGAYDQTVTIRTSDKVKPTLSLRVLGTITAPSTDTAGGLVRPLDVAVTVQGPKNQSEWVEFSHSLGPIPATLHPVKVFSSDYGTLEGYGEVAIALSDSPVSQELFGTGVEGDKVGLNETFAAPMTPLASAVASGQSKINVGDSSAFHVGDEILIIQMQGATAGQHDFARIADRNGNELTLDRLLTHAYTVAGVDTAQIVRVPNYNNVTVTAGSTWRAPEWNGETGGILVFRAAGTITIEAGASIDAGGRGFRGGAVISGQSGRNGPGEGHLGIMNSASANANGSGGGGGRQESGEEEVDYGGGGGGGHGITGQVAQNQGAAGGTISGAETMSLVTLGGGGGTGGGPYDGLSQAGTGGDGGGSLLVFGRTIIVNGSLLSSGLPGGYRAGGGGAGGAIWLRGSDVTLASGTILALGGSGQGENDRLGYGGNGGVGRIRIEYCRSLQGVTTQPSASTQQISCHIAEQVETTPYTNGRLNLPENVASSASYQIQYSRKLDYTSNSEQATTLRVPAGIASSITLDALVTGVGTGNVTFKLDVGNDGTWDWQTTQNVTDATTLSSIDLSPAFNAYWQNNGAPASGNLDVPIKVSLSKAGQVLLTNLQVNSAGSKLRHVQMPAQAVTGFNLDFTVGGTGSGSQTIALDVGADGSIDWSYAANGSFPRKLITGDLKTAINAYLAGKSGLVNVPIRFYVAPDRTITLNDYQSTLSAVLDLVAGSPSGSTVSIAATPTEGDIIPLQATLSNASGIDSGPVTAAFFAEAPGWGDWYIGSAFVANISAGGNVIVNTDWNTTGFYGNVAVKVIVNPYGRLAETGVGNNVGTTSFVITPAAKQGQSISFGALPARTLGIAPFSVSATASSGLAVSIMSSTPGVCTISGSIVTLVAAGTCTLVASQAGDVQFNVATSVSQSFTVNTPNTPKTDQTITFAKPADHTLGDAPFAVTASATSGLPVTIVSSTSAVCTISGNTVTLESPGTCTLEASQAGNAQFEAAPSVTQSFLVRGEGEPKIAQSITFSTPANHTLGDAPFALSASATSGLAVTFTSNSPTICTVSGNLVTLLAAGICEITASQAGNNTYEAAPDVVESFLISGPANSSSNTFLPHINHP